MPKQKTAARLGEGASRGDIVRVVKNIRRADKLEGYVVAVDRRWPLLHLLSPDMFLNGYTALRLSDVKRVEDRGGSEGFAARALRHFGEAPARPEGIELSSSRKLLASAGSQFPLLTIHVEARDPQVCYVGKPVRVSSRAVHLLHIDPDAEWESKPTAWPFSEITRVDFDGRYEQALHAVGGEPPLGA